MRTRWTRTRRGRKKGCRKGERKWEMEKTESRKKVLLTALRAVECGVVLMMTLRS